MSVFDTLFGCPTFLVALPLAWLCSIIPHTCKTILITKYGQRFDNMNPRTSIQRMAANQKITPEQVCLFFPFQNILQK